MEQRVSLVALSLAILAVGTAVAEPEIRGTPGELKDFLQSSSRYVTLDDQATEKAVSDRAIVELSVTTENRSLSAALDANRGVRGRVMADLQAASIRTAEFSTSPEFGLFGSKPSSFNVVNAVSVTVTDEAQFRAAAGLVDRYKEVQLSDTRFEHSGKDKTQERVRKAALDKVMASRRFFEEELGLKLRPVAFGTSGSGSGTNAVEEIIVTTRKMEVPLAMEALDLPDGFDEIEYRARVSVTFEVVPATGK